MSVMLCQAYIYCDIRPFVVHVSVRKTHHLPEIVLNDETDYDGSCFIATLNVVDILLNGHPHSVQYSEQQVTSLLPEELIFPVEYLLFWRLVSVHTGLRREAREYVTPCISMNR